MSNFLRMTAMVSAMAMGTVAYSGLSMAQENQGKKMAPCVGENCPGMGDDGNQGKRMKRIEQDNQSGDEIRPRKRERVQRDNDTDLDVDVDVDVGTDNRRARRHADWKFDSNRHRRSRNKDATFRFYFDGFWYAQPYWDEVYVVPSYRVSCGQGRAIVSERFNRVRVVECRGRTFTYLGRRDGDTFRVVLNSRSGRIVSVREI